MKNKKTYFKMSSAESFIQHKSALRGIDHSLHMRCLRSYPPINRVLTTRLLENIKKILEAQNRLHGRTDGLSFQS